MLLENSGWKEDTHSWPAGAGLSQLKMIVQTETLPSLKAAGNQFSLTIFPAFGQCSDRSLMCVTACPFWNVYAKGLSISSGPLVDAGVEKHHHIGLLLVLPFFKLFLCNLTNKKWSILGFLLQLGNVPFLR